MNWFLATSANMHLSCTSAHALAIYKNTLTPAMYIVQVHMHLPCTSAPCTAMYKCICTSTMYVVHALAIYKNTLNTCHGKCTCTSTPAMYTISTSASTSNTYLLPMRQMKIFKFSRLIIHKPEYNQLNEFKLNNIPDLIAFRKIAGTDQSRNHKCRILSVCFSGVSCSLPIGRWLA